MCMRGKSKPSDLTAEEDQFWTDLAVEVAEIRAKGGGIEIPSEIPDIRAPHDPNGQTDDGGGRRQPLAGPVGILPL